MLLQDILNLSKSLEMDITNMYKSLSFLNNLTNDLRSDEASKHRTYLFLLGVRSYQVFDERRGLIVASRLLDILKQEDAPLECLEELLQCDGFEKIGNLMLNKEDPIGKLREANGDLAPMEILTLAINNYDKEMGNRDRAND